MIIPLGNNVRAEVIDSVLGQLSDGIWENSGAMNKYWLFARTKGTDLEISEDYSKRYGSSRTIWNGFDGKSEKEIRDWFANKAKQVVKIWAEDFHKDPKAVWDRNNTDVVAYMGGHKVRNITVADVYECYDFLKGRSGKKYGTAPVEEPIDEPISSTPAPTAARTSGGMNPSQQDLEDFFLDASTRVRKRGISASRRTFTKYPRSFVKASRESSRRLGYGVEYRDMHSALHGILLATDKATANKVDTICSKLEDVKDEHKYNSLINKLESLDVETIEEINFRDVTEDRKYYLDDGYIQIINPIAYDLYL